MQAESPKVSIEKPEKRVTIDMSVKEVKAFEEVKLGSEITVTLTGKFAGFTKRLPEEGYMTSHISLEGFTVKLPKGNEFSDLAEEEEA